jgi:tetratricopeptide (TPR) repeat protein
MRYRTINRTRFRKYQILTLFAIILLLPGISYSQSNTEKTPIGRVIFEASGGYSMLNGYYEEKLESSPTFFLKASTDMMISPFFIQGIFSYASYGFKESSGSYISRFSLFLGPALRLGIYGPLFLTGGLYITESIFNLKASHLYYTDRTYKTGFAASAGLSFSITGEIIVDAGVLAAQSQLSGEPFRDINYYAGAGYSFNFYPPAYKKKFQETRKALSELEKVEGLYNSGVLSYNEGKMDEAGKYFKKVVDLKAGFRDTDEYIKTISEIKRDMETADKLSREGKKVRAIPLLSKWEKQVPAARRRLNILRGELAGEARELLTRGVRAFDKKEYRKSVRLLSRVLLIDPENKKARLYIDRARRYLDTIEKFR